MIQTKPIACVGKVEDYAVGRSSFLKKQRIACLKSSLKIRANSVPLGLITYDSFVKLSRTVLFIAIARWIER